MLYFSTARAQVDRAEVEKIVSHATAKNQRLGVTGALAYNGRNFCQLLEGEEDVVLNLMRQIKDDPRHAGFKVLDQKEIEVAHFEDWSMQLVDDLDFSTVINAMRV